MMAAITWVGIFLCGVACGLMVGDELRQRREDRIRAVARRGVPRPESPPMR